MPLRTRPTSSGPLPLAAAVGTAMGTAASAVSPTQLALGRVGAGASMVVRPKALPTIMGLDSATSTRMGWAVQMLGIRDLALGVGTLLTLRSGDRAAARTWLTMGAVCDSVDALAIGGAMLRGRVSKSGGLATVAVALGAVAIGVTALQSDEADI